LKVLNTKKGIVIESKSNRIKDFGSFVSDYEAKTPAKIRKNWSRFKVVVDQNMRVVVFSGDTEVEPPELDWILPNSQKLEKWSQLHRILDYFKDKSTIVDKSNSIHFLKQALESLNKVEENCEVIGPIKGLLQLALIRMENASVADFETVKLELNANSEVKFFDERVAEHFEEVEEVPEVVEQEIEEVEIVDEQEIEEVEIVEAKEVPVEVIEIIDDEEEPQAKSKLQPKKKPKPKKLKLFAMTEEEMKKADELRLQKELEKRARIEARNALKDCPHCDKKNFTKDQLKNHFYNNHVRQPLCLTLSSVQFSLNFPGRSCLV
jgi:hypothetical protein